jgi:plasmid maintenance system antidote protein VapI
MNYYFIIEKRSELLEKHTMKEYAEFLEISIPFLCQVLNGKKHTTKALAYAISRYANRSIDYYFEGVE